MVDHYKDLSDLLKHAHRHRVGLGDFLLEHQTQGLKNLDGLAGDLCI